MQSYFSPKALWVIVVLYCLSNLVYFFFFQPYPAVDFTRYNRHSDFVLAGDFSNPNLWFYLGYTAFVSFLKAIGLGLKGVYLFQIIFSVGSFFWLLKRIEKKFTTTIAVLFGVLFTLSFSVWKWNYSLMTESLFISLGLLLLGLLMRPNAVKNAVSIVFIALVMASLRQHGWLVLAVVLVFLGFENQLYKNKYFQFVLVLLLGFVVYYSPLFLHVLEGQSLAHFYKGTIIWGLKSWIYPSPEIDVLQFLQLFFYRIAIEMSGYRPYFSMLHNLVSTSFWLTFNLLVLYSGFRNFRNPLVLFCLSVYLLQFVAVGFTYADWEGRFAYQVYPFALWVLVVGVLNKIKSAL